MNIFHTRKALRIIEQLHGIRQEKYPEYQALLASFYYKTADSLISYIECNTNEMGQLKPLVLPEDPDDLDEGESEDEDDGEEEKQPDDEPKIEDVIDSSVQQPKKTDNQSQEEPAQNEEFEELCQGILDNLGLCEQILSDFV